MFCWKLFTKTGDGKGVSLLYGSLQQKYIGGNAPAFDKALYRLLLVLALLDLNLLRLLPWTRTRSTAALNGFPDAFTLRLVLYGSCAAYLIAAVASIVGMSLGDSSTGLDPGTAIAFAVLSILNAIRMFISTVLYLLSAKFVDANLMLVDKAQVSDSKAAPSTTSDISDVDPEAGIIADELTINPLSSPSAVCDDEMVKNGVDNVAELEGGDTVEYADEDDAYTEDESTHTVQKSRMPGSRESSSADPYVDATLEMLKAQVRKHGDIPVQFIPLPQLKANVALLMRAAMAGEPHDEARLEYLSYCLDVSTCFVVSTLSRIRKIRAL